MEDDLARPRVSGISHLGLSVTDLDRSIAFYRDMLGAVLVRAPYDGDNSSFSGQLAWIRLGSLAIDLYQHAATRDESFDPAQTGLDHLAFVSATREELEAWARWLDEHDVARSPIREANDVASMFDFKDPRRNPNRVLLPRPGGAPPLPALYANGGVISDSA
jgi:glyoxylase I family protein